MSHPFGNLLSQYRARKSGLSLARLANLAGYDKAILVRMGQGKKDLTGPSGRERVVRLIAILTDEGALTTLDEANALLTAAAMPPCSRASPLRRNCQPASPAPPPNLVSRHGAPTCPPNSPTSSGAGMS
jgi:hypothetical protein